VSTALRRGVLVGGAGAVGDMFAAMLARSGVEVCVVDIVPPRDGLRYERCDVTAPTTSVRRAIQQADLVLLAVPEPVALAASGPIGAEMRDGALLAHTACVQSRLASAVRVTGRPQEAVGLNPLFAPELGIEGRPVAAVVLNDGPLVSELLRLVSAAGGRVLRLDAEEHDRLCAISQALTHASVLAFGLALAELDVDIAALSAVAPPPHAAMLALLARIAAGTADVYWDIQSANPHARAARAALARGLDQLLAATNDQAAFRAALQRCREPLGGELESYRQLCARLFHAAPAVPATTPTKDSHDRI
jgi:prephenate dehydrogenase